MQAGLNRDVPRRAEARLPGRLAAREGFDNLSFLADHFLPSGFCLRIARKARPFAEGVSGCRIGILMHRLVAEAIGTFGLMFAGTGAIVINQAAGGPVTHVGIALTFGLIVLAMIYAVGDISGAHLNPAVTIGFWFARRFPVERILPYVAAQAVGAFSASILLRVLFWENETLGATIPAGSWWQSFVLEFFLTALLMFTIMSVATGSKEKGMMAGVAIGALIGLEALFAGPICGASMNPIRSLAPAVVSGYLRDVWIYLLAPVLGALAGVVAWIMVQENPESALKESSPAE